VSSLTLKIAIVAAAVVVAGFAVHLLRQSGVDSVRLAIERQNNAAGTKADSSALDYDACRDVGRVWNFGAGRCGGAAPGRGD
jgi:hypothetical protein